jgi:hypothetical protein
VAGCTWEICAAIDDYKPDNVTIETIRKRGHDSESLVIVVGFSVRVDSKLVRVVLPVVALRFVSGGVTVTPVSLDGASADLY